MSVLLVFIDHFHNIFIFLFIKASRPFCINNMHMRSQKFSGKNKTLSSITPRPPLSSSSRRKSSVNTNSVKSGSQISFK